MDYDRVILELFDRIKVLEEKVNKLTNENKESIQVNYYEREPEKVNYTQLAKNYIENLKNEARDKGKESLILVAGDIQKALGLKNRPVIICNAMQQCMKKNDEILRDTPSGYSTTKKIKYYL